MKRFIISVQVFFLILPARASVEQRERPLKVGVMRYSSVDDTGPAAPVWEKRLGRWLENLEHVEVEAESLPPSVASSRPVPESCIPLQRAIARCQQGFFAKNGSRAIRGACAAIEPFSGEAAAAGNCGEDLQRGWILSGLAAQATGDRVTQAALFRRAVLWHPQGLLVNPFGKEEDPDGFQAADFWGSIKGIKEGIVRDCRVDLKASEIFDALEVNGFPQEVTPSLLLHRGSRWIVKGLRDGKGFRSVVSCPPGSRFRTEVDLVREENDWALKKHLAQVAEKRSLDSLLVVRPAREEIHLFLYQTKEAALKSVPMDKPLMKKDWESGSASLPIRREKLASLLNAEGGTTATDVGSPLAFSLEAGVERDTKWYNNSTFWWVTAGLAVGIAGVILITQQNGQVRPNPTVRIEFP